MVDGANAVWETRLPGLPAPRRGKVRDIYDLGDSILLVATDRLSAYDHILRPAIPGKGRVLNQLTTYWMDRLAGIVPNHLIATEVDDLPAELQTYRRELDGRSALVRKAEVIPFECVARGYLAGSAFKEYRSAGTACGIPLPPGLERAARLPQPIFTPATKAESGHDENVSFEFMASAIGEETASRLRDLTLALYAAGAEHARSVGLLLADTKFEFGMLDGGIVLIDEALTPDSSRYWEEAVWKPGSEPASFDKQFVRNWLDESGWDHESTPPTLPDEVVQGTRDRYVAAFERITGTKPRL
ncbi:MAG: phosphoribosylaminoimidazolesuccinocarboxamide synthase [Thermoanaerobaculia bacterium]